MPQPTPQLYRVFDGNTLIMIAPLATIRRAFRLYPEAEKRIVRETENGACTIHFNNHSYDVAPDAKQVTISKDNV